MKVFLILFSIILTVHVTSVKSQPTYKAGVVEFNLDSKMKRFEKTRKNAERVSRIINSNETRNLDILVFPELILNDCDHPILLKDSDEKQSLCDGSKLVHHVLREIACAAEKSQTYVVINFVMKDDAGHLYNTAMVFDRKGSIIAMYRKYNLFGETGIKIPPNPDVTTFETDFNVTFGIFTSFDILFQKPAMDLVNKEIKNFIYPTMWFTELPYLTAVQIQHGWAFANNVNLLAANVNFLATSSFGSGIYTGRRGSSIAFIATEPTTKVIIADVPVDPSLVYLPSVDRIQENSVAEPSSTFSRTEFKVFSEDLSEYTIKFVSTTGMQSGEVQANGMSCKYEVSITDLGEREDEKTYYYAVASFNGLRSYGNFSNSFTAQRICGVIACRRLNDRNSCGKKHRSSTRVYERFRFDRLDLSTDLPMSNMNIIPSTLAMNWKPLQNFDWSNSTSGNINQVKMKLTKPTANILTFSIYARDYQNDILDT